MLLTIFQSLNLYGKVYIKNRYQYRVEYSTYESKRTIKATGLAENTEFSTIKFTHSLVGQHKVGNIPFKNEMTSLILKLLKSNSNLYLSTFKPLKSQDKLQKLTLYHKNLSYEWLQSSIKLETFEEISAILSKDNNTNEIQCQACGKLPSQLVFLPCLHLAACRHCDKELQKQGVYRCPICKSEVESTIDINR